MHRARIKHSSYESNKQYLLNLVTSIVLNYTEKNPYVPPTFHHWLTTNLHFITFVSTFSATVCTYISVKCCTILYKRNMNLDT